MAIIADSAGVDVTNMYQVDKTVFSVEELAFDRSVNIPTESGVDAVLSNPMCYVLHLRLKQPDPIVGVSIETHRVLKSGGTSRNEHQFTNTDMRTWWASIRFDYGIDITDMVRIEGCVLDAGTRSGPMADRYLVQYANVGIPLSTSRHLMSRIAAASAFAIG